MLQLLQLDRYNTFHVKASCSTHGGEVTYVDNTYDVTIRAQVNNSDIWDGLFLEISHENLKNKIIVGNIYINHLQITIIVLTLKALKVNLNQY